MVRWTYGCVWKTHDGSKVEVQYSTVQHSRSAFRPSAAHGIMRPMMRQTHIWDEKAPNYSITALSSRTPNPPHVSFPIASGAFPLSLDPQRPKISHIPINLEHHLWVLDVALSR